ncbi:MAG: HepT-like ribonuclease domain-containing protein [Oceanicaulis sp.]
MDDILRSIAKIEEFVREAGGLESSLKRDTLHRDAIERRLLIIAEAAAKLRGRVETKAPEIDWNAIRGMGNQIRHAYDDVDTEILRAVLVGHLEPLKRACRRLRDDHP